MGVGGGLVEERFASNGQKSIGPQSVCVVTAVRPRRVTAGGGGVLPELGVTLPHTEPCILGRQQRGSKTLTSDDSGAINIPRYLNP